MPLISACSADQMMMVESVTFQSMTRVDGKWCFPFSISESERMATLTKPQLTTRLMDWDMLWLQVGGESSIIWWIVSLLCHGMHYFLCMFHSVVLAWCVTCCSSYACLFHCQCNSPWLICQGNEWT